MKRIQEQENGPREKKVEAKPVAPIVTQTAQVKTTAVQPVRRPAARQVSEDDEIAKIKRENKAAGSSTATTVESPTVERQSILKKAAPSTEENTTDVSQVLLSLTLLQKLLSQLDFFSNVYDLFVDHFFDYFYLCIIFRQRKQERPQQQLARAVKVQRRVLVKLHQLFQSHRK